jgi:transcription factor SPN1
MSTPEETEKVNHENNDQTDKKTDVQDENKGEVKFDEESDEEEKIQKEESGDDYVEGGEEEEEEKEKKVSENDEDFEISKKKRKRKEPTTKKKRKKSKETSSVEQDQLDEEESNTTTSRKQQSEENEEFDKMMKEFKIIKGKKSKDSEEISSIEEQAEKMAKNVIETMKKASEDDNLALTNKKPATSKLKILSSIVNACSKSFLQPQLLEEKLLDVLAEWIKPSTEDKSLPNMNIRTAVFKILLEIPVKGVTKRVKSQVDFDGIEVSHLRGSEIGKLIKMYSMHPKETPENRKTAGIIIERWSRMIFDLSEDYKSSESPKQANRKRLAPTEVKEDLKKSNRARVPKKAGFDFVREPKSKLGDESKRNISISSESEKNLQRKLRDLSKKTKF